MVSSTSPRTSNSYTNPNRRLSFPRSEAQTLQQQTGEDYHHRSGDPQFSMRQHHTQRNPSSKDTSLSPVVGAGRFTEEWDASQRGSSIIDESYRSNVAAMQRSNSVHSYAAGDDDQLPVRNNTLRKKSSVGRASSLRRSSSRRSNRAGSVRSLALHSASDPDDAHSAFYCPVPTSGTPTDVLGNRFQTWRKVLKDLITYFREIQSHYEQRSKALVKLANVANNISTPPQFLKSAGIDDALQFLRNYNKAAIQEANKAKEIEEDVILALTGLRSDLQQKIKEIKHLSGDFKNSVQREMEGTAKAVRALADVLDKTEVDSSSTTGKQDPYLMRLGVDRQVERQIDEENYLHQAYLNLEGSGRELESIVVGEIQKAYNAYAGILKREADNSYAVVDELREGPIAMPKDQEWIHFVTHDDQIVDPTIPMRSSDQIHYPGQEHISAQEIRAGLLERKSKYLKSYTAGWYVLSTTHLHEFKSADKAQAPVMSLYLPEQKLGSHSSEGGSSNKFILKGRQTGTMHRGHTWVFRAESHDTMMAWYEDIKALTEKTPEERTQFVRTHSRSLSRSSRRSMSSDGIVDEDDEEPFAANQMDVNPEPRDEMVPRRPQPGGRFPSDIQINAQRGLQAPQSPSSVSSGQQDYSPNAQAYDAAGALPVAAYAAGHEDHDLHHSQDNRMGYGGTVQTPMENMPSQAAIANEQAHHDGINPYTSEPVAPATHRDGGYFTGAVGLRKDGNDESEIANKVGDTNAAVDTEEHELAETSTSYLNASHDDHFTNGGIVQNEKTTAAVLAASNIPRSETQQELALQVVPEADAADHVTSAETPIGEIGKVDRKPDNRTDSVATISNLPIPGRFPKGSGVTSP
ncbi:phosphatidylinositol 4,5-bisphosphate-binding protein [Conoideocrella luteorostrata]|uniref:Phosphatidylinositol 4,5-bisphosphate-binding protein n=1 Tax=Conoideocrella luteorostrata TaxID=1105319 RepID=A0AAJ0CW73_9HYPO|nr:phosphatidylinositol 4,5-bisphosphate-binding protein [Conoideocrella luteorostrata]